jgi:hypothetical protein
MEDMENEYGSESKKDWEVECLAGKIKDVEMAKKKKPEIYSKALAMLKDEVDVISSLEDLARKRESLVESEQSSSSQKPRKQSPQGKDTMKGVA